MDGKILTHSLNTFTYQPSFSQNCYHHSNHTGFFTDNPFICRVDDTLRMTKLSFSYHAFVLSTLECATYMCISVHVRVHLFFMHGSLAACK